MLHYIIQYCYIFCAQYVTQNIKRRKNTRNAGNYSDSSSFPEPQKTVILEFARPLSVFFGLFYKKHTGAAGGRCVVVVAVVVVVVIVV